MTIGEIIDQLKQAASEKYKQNVVRLGIPEECTIGVATAELRKFAKKIPKEKDFLLELWATGYHECKIMTVLALKPKECTQEEILYLMDGIFSWDLCDLFCKSVLIKRTDFDDYITLWITSDQLFYKRAAFTLIASTSTHAERTIQEIERYLQLIVAHTEDERLLIKKAASWALKELGKTSEEAQESSIKTAQAMLISPVTAQQWIAKDALKELEHLVRTPGRKRLISTKSKMGQQIKND